MQKVHRASARAIADAGPGAGRGKATLAASLAVAGVLAYGIVRAAVREVLHVWDYGDDKKAVAVLRNAVTQQGHA